MLHHQRQGNGKTLIFIHGNSQSLKTWENLIQEPSLATYTLICVDLPGHGQSFRSTDPEKDYSLKGMSKNLKAFLDSQEEDYIIITNSLAGNLAAEVVTQLPQCKGLFLTGASIIGGKFTVPEIVMPSPYFPVTFTPDPNDADLEGFISTWALQIDNRSKDEFIKIFRDTDPILRVYLGMSIANSEWSDEMGNLKQLKYPVAVVYGEEEKIIFPDYLNRSDMKMWRNEVVKIPAAGHCCHLDQPEQLAGLINQYVQDIFRLAGS